MKDDIGKQMQKQLAMEKTRYILVFYRIYTMPFSQQEAHINCLNIESSKMNPVVSSNVVIGFFYVDLEFE